MVDLRIIPAAIILLLGVVHPVCTGEIISITDDLQYEIEIALNFDTVIHDINDRGEIVGTFWDTVEERFIPYYWSPAAGFYNISEDFNTLPEHVGEALGINNEGLVVGYCGPSRFLWSREEGVLHDDLPLAGAAINDHGVIAGILNQQVCTWDKNNGLQEFGNLGSDVITVSKITNQGEIVGRSHISPELDFDHAFLVDQQGNMHDLGGVSEDSQSFLSLATAMNDSGIIVGSVDYEAVFWNKYFHISTLGIRGHATDINNDCIIVGYSIYDETFLWHEDTGVLLLGDCLTDNSSWDTLSHAPVINNKGQIVGVGCYNDQPCTYVMTPVPEPLSWISMLFGMTLITSKRKSRSLLK